ncbi:Receptor-like protein kinase HERK 1 [Morus notabilis]|uniref:non-specific serine/threonine protein kinase n=1 Tax=Morus notabilis TaxID=981085 RepID=W9R508_9ROSA|nr:Receptor-like protein kinase HERK 1 [Morus notabilis]
MSYMKVVLFISIFHQGFSSSSGFDPIDNYLIDCGSPTNTSVSDRVFISDYTASKFLSTPQDVLANTTNKSTISSSDSPLYQTARIFTQTSTYKFPILRQGRHWIRLYFSPFSYEAYDMTTARFSVFTENHVLLSDFCTYDTTYLKEFSVNVTSNSLVITLSPSANSFAFLNAVEVVSVPDELITNDSVSIVVSLDQYFEGLSSQAFETVARVNMGGPMVFSENDTLWRTWVPDQSFLVHKDIVINVSNIDAVKYITGGKATPNIAPAIVYGTATILDLLSETFQRIFNITWEFKVDQGFHYLIRFHFCDIISDYLNTLYLNVYINSWSVATNLDTSALSSYSLGSPFYMDCVTMSTVSNKLRVTIGSSIINGDISNGILNGLEILKINNSIGNLGSPAMSSIKEKNIAVLSICVSIGGFLVVTMSVVFLLIICKKLKKSQAHQGHSKTTATAIDASKYETRIPFPIVQEATNNFDESLVIGTGGFGKVYKGVLSDGTKVAVKRKNPGSQQGLQEFRTEIKMLLLFRHRHLVSLIGYCDEGNEMILIYEYMENGALRSHLHGSELQTYLTWKQRLEICIGAARGLHYLHTGFAKGIIHRDVKSANILLDENFRAKVADFGLSKIGPDMTQANHVSTAVKGSFGYFDPEYFRRRRLTFKSDVYSFGVVLFEVLCGRAAVDSTQISPESLKKFGEIAEKCLAEVGVNRPSMGEVLQSLECALRLQEAAEKRISAHMSDDRKLQHSVSAFEFSCTRVGDDHSSGYRVIKSSLTMKVEDKWLLRDDHKSYGHGFSC